MRTTLYLLTFMWLMVLAGCGGDDGVSPDPDPETPPVVQGTIGAGGGELATDDVVLTVPAGALFTDTDLAIYDETDSAPFGQEGAPVYAISGLPRDLGGTVRLRFRHGVDDPDSPGLFLGEQRDTRSAGRALTWATTACTDSSGWCLTELRRGPYFADEKHGKNLQAAWAQGMAATDPSAHFQVVYLESDFDADRAAWSLAMLEEAYDNLVGLGFNFGAQDTIWPVPAFMVVPDSSIACFVNGSHGLGYFQFPPHTDEPNNTIRSIYQHEVFHLAQMWYDTRDSQEWISLNTARLWLDEATASWSELHFYPALPWPLSWTSDNAFAPLGGLHGYTGLPDAQYGYGMCTFIKTLVEQQSAGDLHDLYEAFVLHDQNPVAALQAVLEQPDVTWCLDYHRDLLLGRVYDTLDTDMFWDYGVEDDIYRDIGNTKELLLSVNDFGSAVCEIELVHAMDDDAEADRLRLRASDGLSISVFVVSDITMPDLIAVGVDSVTIDDLDGIQATGGNNSGRPLIMLTKDWSTAPGWDGSLEAFLEVEMLPPGNIEAYTRIDSLSVTAEVTWADATSGTHHMVIIPDVATDGEWIDDEFQVEWYLAGADTSYWGAMYLTIDDETLDLTSFAMARNFYEPISGGVANDYEVNGESLPLVSMADGVATWRAEGAAACATLTTLLQRERLGSETTRLSTGFSCLDSGADLSFVEIRLSDPGFR